MSGKGDDVTTLMNVLKIYCIHCIEKQQLMTIKSDDATMIINLCKTACIH